MRVHAESPTIRPAAVAGSFYPRDPSLLRQTGKKLLTKGPGPQTDRPKALIALTPGMLTPGLSPAGRSPPSETVRPRSPASS